MKNSFLSQLSLWAILIVSYVEAIDFKQGRGKGLTTDAPNVLFYIRSLSCESQI